MTEENSQFIQIKSTIVDQFLNVSKEFVNFANFFTQKVKVLSTYEFYDHIICIKKNYITFWDFLYNLFAVELIAQKMYIKKQLWTNIIWYFISSAEMLMLFTSKKMKCCDRTLIIENSTQSFSRINILFCWSMKLLIILQMSSDLLNLTSRTRSTNFAYKKKMNERWHFIQDLTYTSILWCSLISSMHRLSFRFI